MDHSKLIETLPKAELHCHIEGTLEPELMIKLAEKNRVSLPYDSVQAVHQAYEFENLQSFLDLYYLGTKVLQTEQDFYDLTWAYLKKAQADHIIHTEIFFDPQAHTERGIAFPTVIEGIHQALRDAEKKLNISSKLILCFLRHLPEEDAFRTLEQARPYKTWIEAVGLDSSELGYPPSQFKNVFEMAKQAGFKAVAHAGEEGPAAYIWEAIEQLGVQRIDHGFRCLEDPKLVQYLKDSQLPLTVCPLSNVKLKTFQTLKEHTLPDLVHEGLRVTINSDDPAYFGGYLNENFSAISKTFNFDKQTLVTFVKNSFIASFLNDEEKERALKKVDESIQRLDKAS